MVEGIKYSIEVDDKGSSKLNKAFGAIKSGANITKGFGKAIVGTTGAVVAFNAAVAVSIDKQAKFASRLGVNVTELTSYQFAATQAGLTTETFNMAMQRATRRSAEAAKGMGEAKGALRTLGIDAKSFTQLSLDDQMTELAGAMEGVESESERLRLAFKLFDSEGTAMIQMLGQGTEAMRAAANDANFLGVAISKQAAAQSELFTDKMGRATASLKGLSNAIAGETMPILTGLADSFANLVARNRGDIANFVKNSIVGVTTVGIVFADAFKTLKHTFTSFDGFKAFLSNLGDFAKAVFNTFKELLPLVGKLISVQFKAYLDMFKGFAASIRDVFSGIIESIKAGEFKKAFTDIDFSGFRDGIAAAGADGFSQVFENAKTFAGEASTAIAQGVGEASGVAMETLGVNLEAATEKAKALIESISLFATTTAETTKEGLEITSQFTEAFQESQSQFMEWLGESSRQFVETLHASMQTTIDSLSSGIAGAIVSGSSLLDAFKNVAKQLVASVIAALIKMGLQRLILAKLTSGLNTSQASQEASKAVGLAGANMFASMAAAPFPINLTAPAAASAAVAGASATFAGGAAAGAALGASIGGIAHGGLSNNPSEQTFLIRKGERVISPRQNEDLTQALEGGSIGGNSIKVDNIIMFPNATNAEAVLSMDTQEIAEKMEDALITALNNLDDRGVRPNFVERGGV